jgi:hypothetical protein
MASPKLGARSLAALALAAAGCYATTPHVAEVAVPGRADAGCSAATDAVQEVFARSGFVELPPRGHVSMLFGARTRGPYTSFLTTDSGVGVTVHRSEEDGTCHVAIEALSPDASCPGSAAGSSGAINCQRPQDSSAPSYAYYGPSAASAERLCPPVPVFTCDLTYAPGEQNDAAVDELARRVQAELGSRGRVN